MLASGSDQHRQLSLLLDQASDFVAKRVPLCGTQSLFGQSEFEGQAVQGIECAAGGQRHVGRSVQSRWQLLHHLSAAGGFATAGFAGDQADAAQFQQMLEAGFGFAHSFAVEQLRL